MFTFARMIVRNKGAAVALVALGAFALLPGEEEPAAPTNPWALQPAAPATVPQAEEGGFVDDIITETTAFLDEHGLNPAAGAEEAVGRFDDTASAYSQANTK